MADFVKVYRELLRQTPVDEPEVQERPVVHFRASENTCLEAIVRYLVHPKESGRVKTRLTKKLLDKLNSEPERVLFPKSNLRCEILCTNLARAGRSANLGKVLNR